MLRDSLRQAALLARALLRRPDRYAISGGSMAPTLLPGDRVLVDRRAFEERDPIPGEVVMVRHPHEDDFIRAKRVVGLPGQRVRIHDGQLLVDGTAIREPYVVGDSGPDTEIVLAADTFAVLGDNRYASTDSRDFGPVHRSRFIGPIIYRYLPGTRRGPIERARALPLPRRVIRDQAWLYTRLRLVSAVLLAWGLTGIVAGTRLLRRGPFARGAGIQCLVWGTVDATIAVVGWRAVGRTLAQVRRGELDPDRPARDAAWLERLLWANACLDVVYVLIGARGAWTGRRDAARAGAGAGVVLQGSFLLTFDLANAVLLRRARQARRRRFAPESRQDEAEAR